MRTTTIDKSKAIEITSMDEYNRLRCKFHSQTAIDHEMNYKMYWLSQLDGKLYFTKHKL